MNETTTKRQLLSAILSGRKWLPRFTMNSYASAFKQYVEEFGPTYMEASRTTPSIPALASELLDGMEASWAGERIWNRTAARMDTLQMLVNYLSPMLLGLEEPACGELAKCICDGWAERRPKEAYRTASYQKVRGGFRRAILGIPLPDRQSEPEE